MMILHVRNFMIFWRVILRVYLVITDTVRCYTLLTGVASLPAGLEAGLSWVWAASGPRLGCEVRERLEPKLRLALGERRTTSPVPGSTLLLSTVRHVATLEFSDSEVNTCTTHRSISKSREGGLYGETRID